MISRRASSASQRPRARKAPWRLARTIFLILMTLHSAAACLKPGKTRRGLIRFLRLALPKLEFCLRCLLVGMRAEATLPKPAPFTPRGEGTKREAPLPRRAPVFSLSLKGIAPDAAQPPAPIVPNAAKPQTGRLVPPREETFAARLRNIEAVFSNPVTFAQKIAARLKRRGLRLRAPKTLRPVADLWQALNDKKLRLPPQYCGPQQVAHHPDTS